MRTTRLGEPAEARRRAMAAEVAATVEIGVRTRAALEAVPRHLLVPGRSVRDAYGHAPVVVKADADGVVSSTAEPAVQALLLELAQLSLGQRVLLAGAAPGITAAMIEHLVGPLGQVTALEADADLAGRARLALVATGHHRTHVLHGDATEEQPFHDREFDRIVVAGSVPGIPAAWWRWLRPGGRLVVPLRAHGHTRIVAFVHEGERMTSEQWVSCQVPALRWAGLPGGGADLEVPLGGGRTLHLGHDRPDAARTAVGAMAVRGQVRWSGVTIPSTRYLDDLALALIRDGAAIGRLAGPAPAPAGTGSPVLVDGGRMATVIFRPAPGPPDEPGLRWQLGTAAYGDRGEALAHDLLTQAGTWAAHPEHRPVFHAYPAKSPRPAPGSGIALAGLHGGHILVTP